MRDLNFFEHYIDKRDLKFDRKLIYSSIGIFIVLIFFMYSIFNHVVIRQEEKVVSSLKSVVENEKTIKRVEDIKLKEKELLEFRDSVEKIMILNANLDEIDIINKDLIDEINRKMPKEMYMSSMTIGADELKIIGVSDDKWSIAEFGKGLEDVYDLGDVFISNISSKDGNYIFNIDIISKDVIIDAESDEIPEEEIDEDDEI